MCPACLGCCNDRLEAHHCMERCQGLVRRQHEAHLPGWTFPARWHHGQHLTRMKLRPVVLSSGALPAETGSLSRHRDYLMTGRGGVQVSSTGAGGDLAGAALAALRAAHELVAARSGAAGGGRGSQTRLAYQLGAHMAREQLVAQDPGSARSILLSVAGARKGGARGVMEGNPECKPCMWACARAGRGIHASRDEERGPTCQSCWADLISRGQSVLEPEV